MPDVRPKVKSNKKLKQKKDKTEAKEGQPAQPDEFDFQEVRYGQHRPCALLNTPLPYLRNAFENIQELKALVDNEFQQHRKNHPQMGLNKQPDSQNLRFQRRGTDDESVMSTEMVVEGLGLTLKEDSSTPPLLKKTNDVLREVLCLMDHLESDRQKTEEALQKQEAKKQIMQDLFDDAVLKKQHKHEAAVQKEHEACRQDISELKGQLKKEYNKLEELKDKLAQSERKNQHLKENITFYMEQIPIVKDKTNFERSLINQIQAEQQEADNQCLNLRDTLAKVEKKYNDIKLMTESEKKSMEHTLTSLSCQRANQEDYLEALISEKIETDEQVNVAKESLAQAKETFAQLSGVERTYKDEILNIKTETEEQVKKNAMLEMQISSFQKDLEATRRKGEAEISCAEEELVYTRDAYNAQVKENMGIDEKEKHYKTKITKSKNSVKQMREEIKRMLQNISDNDKKWKDAKEELTQVEAQHSATQAKQAKQKELSVEEEKKTRARIDVLMKNLTEQVTRLEKLKIECENIKDKINHHQKAAEQTNLKLDTDFEEASSAVKALQTGNENKKLKQQLDEKLIQQLEEKQDQLQAAKDLHAATVQLYDSTVDEISEITKQTTDLQKFSEKMEKAAESLPVVIEELESDLAAEVLKNKSAALIVNTLQSDINNTVQRTQRTMQMHTTLVTSRKRLMEDKEEALKVALSENKELASNYKRLTEERLDAKHQSAQALTEKNRAQRELDYYNKLKALQTKMHKALEKYFELRSLYSQAELDQCQALSQETERKIITTQKWLEAEVHAISEFLQSL